ncbi:MAG: peptidase associated/transthyretin-like domain-containing protein, partial [Planctomycetota bacterium]
MTNIRIYNNTHYFSEGISPEIIGPKLGRTPFNSTFNNNIFYSASSGTMGLNAENGTNVIYDTNVYVSVEPPASEANGLTADPLFVAPGDEPKDVDMENGRDVLAGYRLSSRSPYLGNGLMIEDRGALDFWGQAIPKDSASIGASAHASFPKSAGPAAVNGVVLDSKNQPLGGCEILHGTQKAATDAEGRFELLNPRAAAPGETERLQINCQGYAPRFVALEDGQSELGAITLKRHNFILLLSDDQGWVQTSKQMDPDDPETRS